MADADLIPVGVIVGAFGIKGAVKVQPLTDFAERFEPGRTLLLDGKEAQVESIHWKGQQARIQIDLIKSPEEAASRRGAKLFARSDDPLTLDEDEWHVRDLIGLTVVDVNRGELGPVDAILPFPAHDVLSVAGGMIPMVHEHVHEVDIEGGKITVEVLEGMMPGDADVS